MIGNDHARFWIGGGRSNPFADHTGMLSCNPLCSLTALKGKRTAFRSDEHKGVFRRILTRSGDECSPMLRSS